MTNHQDCQTTSYCISGRAVAIAILKHAAILSAVSLHAVHIQTVALEAWIWYEFWLLEIFIA